MLPNSILDRLHTSGSGPNIHVLSSSSSCYFFPEYNEMFHEFFNMQSRSI